MACCGVRNCGNNYRNCKKSGKDVSFFRIPSTAVRELWTQKIQISKILNDSRVCSVHFQDSDFIHDQGKKVLKPEAVPSINLPLKKHTLKLQPKLDQVNEKLNRRVNKLKLSLNTEKKKTKVLEAGYRKILCQLKIDNVKLKNKLVKSESKLVEQQNAISKVFSPAQMKILLSNNMKVRWSEEDISKSIVLKAKSSSAYQLLRENWGIPLPSPRTLRRWTSQIEFQPGLIKPVLNLMKEQFKNSNKFSKQCILGYDEMAVDGLMGYDLKNDRIIGPHNNMMIVYIRALFDTWKQPVFFDFDFKLTKSGLSEILNALHEIGLECKGTVCDLAPSNRSIKKELNISLDQTSFKCPASGRNIWLFYDFPHLIKRLRDNTLDYIITLADGTTFSVDDFKLILQNDSNELRVCHKLTNKHITCQGRERMNVRLAMQLFSRSVAKCFKNFFSYSPRLQRLAEFVELVNDFADILNSRCASQEHFTASVEQMKVLDKMEEEMLGLRVGKLKYLQPFQTGFVISIRSLRGLFQEMRNSPLCAKYIITCRLNQDFVENGFSVIRGLGFFYLHPSPLDAINRLKCLMLGWTFNQSKNCTTEALTDTQPYLTSGILKCLMSNENHGENVLSQMTEELEMELDEINTEIRNPICEDNWTEHYNSLNFKDKFGSNAQEYVFGYIVSKLKEKYPDLILSTELEHRVPSSWTQDISKANLSLPSYTWLNIFRKFEEFFLVYHRKPEDNHFEVNRSYGVCKELQSFLADKFPDLPHEVIKLYVRVRTMVRIKAINNELSKRRFRRINKNCQFMRRFGPEASNPQNTTTEGLASNLDQPIQDNFDNEDEEFQDLHIDDWASLNPAEVETLE